jgi:glycosyltransferase involved in cell wall biosynthesis
MKIAVYSIALNESQFVERWYNSAKDADYLLIADTGSTDNTYEIAKSLGINVYKISINPWRFDDARNAALSLIPSDIDYCISLDMDEVLSEGWRKEMESLSPGVTRPMHKLATHIDETGTAGIEFEALRIHARNGYRWKYPIHEFVAIYSGEEIKQSLDIKISHHPDNNKSRGQYLGLLQMAAKEDPYSDRCAHYYARELFYYGAYEQASQEFKRHLSLESAVWKAERCESMRYIAKCEPHNSEYWLRQAILECPERREPYVDLAQVYYEKRDWEQLKEFSTKALDIKTKYLGYFCEADAWGWKPHDLLALASYNLGDYNKALDHGKMALGLKYEPRLATNVLFYEEALKKGDTSVVSSQSN